jgi:hypothetical protein
METKMNTFQMQDHNLRQAELIKEAEKVRLIRSLRESKSSSKKLARKVQGIINTISLT